MSLSNAITDHLKTIPLFDPANTDFRGYQAVIGSKAKNSDRNFVGITVDDNIPTRVFGGKVLFRTATLTIDCYAFSKPQVEAMSDAIGDDVDGFQGPVSYLDDTRMPPVTYMYQIMSMNLRSSNRTPFENKLYRGLNILEVQFRQTNP